MVLNEIKQQKYNLLFLGLFAVIAILIFQQSQMIAETNKSEIMSSKDIRHTFNQSLNNFDGIVMSVNLTKQNHLDHQTEIANQAVIMNQTITENGLLKSINASLGKMIVASNLTNVNENQSAVLSEKNATLRHYN